MSVILSSQYIHDFMPFLLHVIVLSHQCNHETKVVLQTQGFQFLKALSFLQPDLKLILDQGQHMTHYAGAGHIYRIETYVIAEIAICNNHPQLNNT